MDQNQEEKVERADHPDIPQNEIRISAKAGVGRYVRYVYNLMEKDEKTYEEIILKAAGRAMEKVVPLVEILKRRIKGLHQLNKITSTTETRNDGSERTIVTLEIRLSKNKLSDDGVGYQEPIPESEVEEYKEVMPKLDDEEESSRGRGHRGGRGTRGGRGSRGGNRGGNRGGRGGRGSRGGRGGRGGYHQDNQYDNSYNNQYDNYDYYGEGGDYNHDDYYNQGYDNSYNSGYNKKSYNKKSYNNQSYDNSGYENDGHENQGYGEEKKTWGYEKDWGYTEGDDQQQESSRGSRGRGSRGSRGGRGSRGTGHSRNNDSRGSARGRGTRRGTTRGATRGAGFA